MERYELATERLKEICRNAAVEELYREFFLKEAEFLLKIRTLFEQIRSGEILSWTQSELMEMNRELYREIFPENYGSCYGDPEYAVSKAGEAYGKAFCFLYAELRASIPAAFEQNLEELTILAELFISIYNLFEDEPSEKALRERIYWFESDYCEILAEKRVRQNIDPSMNFAVNIVEHADLSDLSYLYYFGEYISENERKTAEFLQGLSVEEIERIAEVYTEGYRVGFVKAGKDLSKKKTVDIRYTLGFERVIRAAIERFRKMGLEPILYRPAYFSMNRRSAARIGYVSTEANPQYTYDHRMDQAYYMDKRFLNRRLEVMKSAYEHNRALANGYAGPAVLETFGEVPFSPKASEHALRFNEKQQKQNIWFTQESTKLVNEFIIREERSFTIIAFPIPQIGENFPEVFREVVKINTLDAAWYELVQGKLIDALDEGEVIHIRGRGENHTDLTIALWDRKDPAKETLFENCVADVNIPVGEVFTSPRLTGTNGILEATEVYLNGLQFKDLHVELKDGMVSDYTCGNFEQEADNRKYFLENVLFHHPTLPIGEFAIGTNTTAYRAAKRLHIEDRFPILIAEKCGPHFALGDTCYSWEEENAVYNPDGKEIIARDNEVSRLRTSSVSDAYFGCHTDITIPWDELDTITVVKKDGTQIPVIAGGRFVLPGAEALNIPLDEPYDPSF